MNIITPIQWPLAQPQTRPLSRLRSRFELGSPQRVLGDLSTEVRLLGADTARLTCSTRFTFEWSQSGRAAEAGVALYFGRGGHTLVFACDRYSTITANVIAITKHIAALRAIDRHGVGALDQVFVGYRALPERTDARDCYAVLGVTATATGAEMQAAFRRQAKRAHPDAGGSDAAMAELNNAYEQAQAQHRTAQ